MNDSWRTFPRAPEPGTELCRSDLVARGETLCLEINGFPVLLLRGPSGLKAYINACPHQFLPLNYRSDSILSADGRRLVCSNHSAGFDAATGAGTDGLDQGCALIPVPVRDHEGRVVIG